MDLKYNDEQTEDILYKKFYEETKENWTQIEQPNIRDFIKWLIIKAHEEGCIYLDNEEKMINKKQLDIITQDLKEKIWCNEDLQDEYYTECNYSIRDRTDMIYIISTLHNLLYETVTGKPYNYAWHWLNKVNGLANDGCDTLYDSLIGRNKGSA